MEGKMFTLQHSSSSGCRMPEPVEAGNGLGNEENMSTASQAFGGDALRRLPRPILDKMQILIRRVRRVAICKGVLAVAATGLICLLAIMAVDAAVTIFLRPCGGA